MLASIITHNFMLQPQMAVACGFRALSSNKEGKQTARKWWSVATTAAEERAMSADLPPFRGFSFSTFDPRLAPWAAFLEPLRG